jgi:predicted RNase H-like nuclease (RuvC/YqgF family)
MLVRPTPSKPKFQPAASAPIEPPREKFRPAPRAAKPEGSAINRAVNEVTEIVESLRQALEQMEEVLELVELAERQKITDEREIESLLHALRQFQSRGGRLERQERPQSDD